MSSKEWGGVILNPGCSNRCIFCGYVPKVIASELRQQEVKVAKNLVDFKNEGIKKVEISGGDPIEYDKIISLIEYIKKAGFEYVQLSTHGNNLSDKSFVKELEIAGLDKLRIPLYGSNAKVHDSITQLKGSFESVIKGIKNVISEAPSMQLQVSSLIMQQNKNDLIRLIDLVHELGIIDFYFSIPCVSNEDYSYYIPLKDLGIYVNKACDHASKTSYRVVFREIPYCVFGIADRLIVNYDKPPNLGKYCQPPDRFRTLVKDLPSYRVKEKVKMCEGCKCFDFCEGFFVNDTKKFGTGNLKPIK